MAVTPKAPVPQRDEEPSGLALTLRASLRRRIDDLDEAQLLEAARLLEQVSGSKPTRRERALIQRWIEPHPRGSYRARVVGAGVPVYAIVGQLGLASETTDDQLAKVAENYQVSLAAARAALAYYRQHRFLIDAWLAMNAE